MAAMRLGYKAKFYDTESYTEWPTLLPSREKISAGSLVFWPA